MPDRRLIVVDGGARGAPFAPMDRVAASQRTLIRFEPDADAGMDAVDDIVISAALWDETGYVPLHLTRQRSCSSVYPPDPRLVDAFAPVLGFPARSVDDTVSVPATTIDSAVALAGAPPPDFIKLDIHSAEYEALVGSRSALDGSVVGILVEAWPLPIHKGQRPYHELERLVHEAHFVPFDIQVGRWPHRARTSVRYASRPQSVQVEVLYLLDAAGDRVTAISPERLLTLIVITELFGIPSYGLRLISDALTHRLFSRPTADALCSAIVQRNRVPAWQYHVSRLAQRCQRALDTAVVPIAGH